MYIPGTTLDTSLFPDPVPFFSELADFLTVPERLPLSQWMEKNMRLSSRYSARPGPIHLFGWQREIADAVTDARVEGIVGMFSTQTFKTLIDQAAIMYRIVEDPCPILLVMPNDDDARTFSKERLGPMIEDNPLLKSRVSTERSGANQSTMEGKIFPNGSLSLVGATTPGNLARRSVGLLICDEVDKYGITAGREGDPIRLGMERLATYESRKKWILTCSPTIAGRSRIARAYENSDQRKPWAKCPKCGKYQLLSWAFVKWDASVPREKAHRTAYYQCAHCPERWNDQMRRSAAEACVWRAEREFEGVAGFWISQLYAPWKKLSEMVKNWLEVKDNPPERQVFVNTVLAELWTDDGEMPDAEKLYARRESYPFGNEAVVPARALVLTAFCDVQDNPPRLEVETKAWGRGRECWSLDYRVIEATAANGEALPVSSKVLWDMLDAEVLQRNWLHESGALLAIHAMGIDTGNRPAPVYAFARRHTQAAFGPAGIEVRQLRTVIPTKGNAESQRLIPSYQKESGVKPQHMQGARILMIGTHYAKREIYDALRSIVPQADGSLSGIPTPSCYHHPEYSREFFEGLTSEVRVIETNGRIKWKKIRDRNEPLDTVVGNRAIAEALGISRWSEDQWCELENAIWTAPKVASVTVSSVVQSSGGTDASDTDTESGSLLPSSSVASAALPASGGVGDERSDPAPSAEQTDTSVARSSTPGERRLLVTSQPIERVPGGPSPVPKPMRPIRGRFFK